MLGEADLRRRGVASQHWARANSQRDYQSGDRGKTGEFAQHWPPIWKILPEIAQSWAEPTGPTKRVDVKLLIVGRAS